MILTWFLWQCSRTSPWIFEWGTNRRQCGLRHQIGQTAFVKNCICPPAQRAYSPRRGIPLTQRASSRTEASLPQRAPSPHTGPPPHTEGLLPAKTVSPHTWHREGLLPTQRASALHRRPPCTEDLPPPCTEGLLPTQRASSPHREPPPCIGTWSPLHLA